jgi:hypothetical protein
VSRARRVYYDRFSRFFERLVAIRSRDSTGLYELKGKTQTDALCEILHERNPVSLLLASPVTPLDLTLRNTDLGS